MYSRVIIPVDGSEISYKAVESGKEMALKGIITEIIILTVVDTQHEALIAGLSQN